MTNHLDTYARKLSNFRSIGVQPLRKAVVAILSIWILFSLLRLISLAVTPAESLQTEGPQHRTVGNEQKKPPIDINRIKGFALFGAANVQADAQQPVVPTVNEEEINAAETKLDLKLQGIVYSPDQSQALAVILYKKRQDQYRVGDKLPVGRSVRLSKVLMDRVIIENSGRYESLWLYDESDRNTNLAVEVQADDGVIRQDMRANQSISNLVSSYRDRLFENPMSLAQVIQISPAQKDGAIIGYRVSPGRDRDQFKQLGFRPNDIVTSINNVSLDEPANALKVYSLMRNATEASFTVQRGNEVVELMVALNESN